MKRVFVFCLLMFCLRAQAQEGSVEFRTQPFVKQAQLGDRVEVHLVPSDPAMTADRIVRVEIVPEPERWFDAQPWSPPNPMKKGGAAQYWHAVLQGFETGDSVLPRARVTYRLPDGTEAETMTTTATLTIASAMQVAASAAPGPDGEPEIPELFGPKPIYKFPREWRAYAAGAAAALVALVAAYLIYRRMRSRVPALAPAPVEPPLPPGAWALRELEVRRQLPVSADGPGKAIASLVSEVVRVYIHKRFEIDALDRTSYECLSAISRYVTADTLGLLRRFFNDCDFAKFTDRELPRERWDTLWDDAREFVLATTPAEELNPTKPMPMEPARAGASAR